MISKATATPLALGLVLILLVAFGAALAIAYVGGGTGTEQTSPSAVTAPVQVSAAAVQAGPQRFVLVPAQSSVTYRVDETLFNEGNRLQTAVGTTREVRGEVTVNRAQPAASRIGTITIDISQFKSDSQRRDNAIRGRWLESAKYPTAEFTSTEITGLPASYEDGRDIPVEIEGNLSIRDVTKPVTWTATIRLEGNRLTVTGKTAIKMTDFGFAPPSLFFLKAEDEVRLEFRFVALN